MKALVRTGLALILVSFAAPAARGAVPPPVVSYSAPAGWLPAGHLHGLTYAAVLPSGRLVRPAGTNVVVGMDAQGIALSPDGRFAIVSNDDERNAGVASAVDPLTFGGYSLAVVDTATMTVVDRYRGHGETFFAGLVAVPDPQDASRTLVLAAGGSSNVVYAFTLDSGGHLVPDRTPAIPIPAPGAGAGPSFPDALVASRDGRRAYVVSDLGDAVAALDTGRRTLLSAPAAVGYRPCAAAVAGDRLLVTDEGLMDYRALSAPAAVPPFAQPPADLQHASSLSLVNLTPDGSFASDDPADAVPMDPAPDGLATVGGAHPAAIVTTADGQYAFVAMASVDRVATVQLEPTPHVIGGVELRLFDRGPYGTQPTALALSRDGSRLYVALTGLDAIAVIDAHDPLHLHRLGLIPTGWAPSALALAPDDRTLYVTNARGFGADSASSGDATAVWSTLQRIDLASIRLADSTRATLADTRHVVTVPPKYPKGIRNVVLILERAQTFDSALGDLGYGPVDPTFAATGESPTPNLYALAREFAIAGNFFADADTPDAGHQYANAGIATDYTERHAESEQGRGPFASSEDPEDYPRFGYLFNALARHSVSFRDYGELLQVAGYVPDPTIADADDPGLGGRYRLDVPAPAILGGHVDLNYPGPNALISDQRRADEFIRDFGALGAAGRPRFTAIWLPGSDPSDDDLALGKVVAYLTHLGSWRSTAIIVMPVAAAGRDHVDAHRTFAIVISPYGKRRYVGMHHLSTASVLKTIDRIFSLPSLSLGDLLATDMSDFFRQTIDARPYEALPVAGRS